MARGKFKLYNPLPPTVTLRKGFLVAAMVVGFVVIALIVYNIWHSMAQMQDKETLQAPAKTLATASDLRWYQQLQATVEANEQQPKTTTQPTTVALKNEEDEKNLTRNHLFLSFMPVTHQSCCVLVKLKNMLKGHRRMILAIFKYYIYIIIYIYIYCLLTVEFILNFILV